METSLNWIRQVEAILLSQPRNTLYSQKLNIEAIPQMLTTIRLQLFEGRSRHLDSPKTITRAEGAYVIIITRFRRNPDLIVKYLSFPHIETLDTIGLLEF